MSVVSFTINTCLVILFNCLFLVPRQHGIEEIARVFESGKPVLPLINYKVLGKFLNLFDTEFLHNLKQTIILTLQNCSTIIVGT